LGMPNQSLNSSSYKKVMPWFLNLNKRSSSVTIF
jgi:hypothetical protein